MWWSSRKKEASNAWGQWKKFLQELRWPSPTGHHWDLGNDEGDSEDDHYHVVDSEYRLGRCFREIQFTRTPLKEDFSTRAKRRKLLKEVKFSLVSGKLSNYVLMKRICIYAYTHMLLIVGAMIMKRQMTMTMKRQMTNGKWQMTNNKWQYAGLWLQLQLSFVLSSNQRGGGWWLEEARGEVSTMMVLGGNNVLGNNVLGNNVLGGNSAMF